MLKERKYKVRPVPSGKLALLAAARDPPDLILLDINMPEMNGYQVCEALKADEILKGIPIIFISALTEPLDKVKAFATGGVDYITKPFHMEELHARVEAHLKIRRLQIELERLNGQLARANTRMSLDLGAAAKIQKTFLPGVTPNIPGLAFAWGYRPCEELGGDGLNIVQLGNGKVGLYILDVSGHGVSAALLSVSISRLLSSPSEPSSILRCSRNAADPIDITPPAEVASRLNELFPFGTATEQYATLLYGILDVKSGDFLYVSAGHPGPLHVPARGAAKIIVNPGFPIGLAEEAYGQEHIHLSPGDRLYLYSDGLTDAMSAQSVPFGNALLLLNIERERTKPLEQGVAALLNEIATWHGSERSQDDISMLAIEIAG